ncbi:hypothetical protein [Corallococcus sicarius]|uniref:hypothetical protein n=1 Tax=Corallococcus sicarius TaxID=2316726 RepID=UPI001FC940BB|nr:hypothetical protein [Corallococcus sicarius]
MGGVSGVGGSGASKVDPAEAQRRAEAARQKAEAARLAAEAQRKATTEARDTLSQARLDANSARRQKAAAEKGVADARKAAEKPGQTPEEAQKSKDALAAAEKKLKEANEASRSAAQKLKEAEEKATQAANSAEKAMRKANAAALDEGKTPPFSQKDFDKLKPPRNEFESVFEATGQKVDLEKLMGLTPPPQQEVIQSAGAEGAPGIPLDAVAPFEGSPVGEPVPYDAAPFDSVPPMPDGSDTSSMTPT